MNHIVWPGLIGVCLLSCAALAAPVPAHGGVMVEGTAPNGNGGYVVRQIRLSNAVITGPKAQHMIARAAEKVCHYRGATPENTRIRKQVAHCTEQAEAEALQAAGITAH